MGDLDFLEEHIRFLFLHWVRCLALIGPLPIFGAGKTALLSRVGLGVSLGTVLAFTSDLSSYEDPGFNLILAGYIAKELFVGFLFAYIALLTFTSLRIAGHIIGTEMGFNMAAIQDPATGAQTQLMAHLFESFGLVILFATGGHQLIMRALARSFKVYPVTTFQMDEELVYAVVLYASSIFRSGLQVAAPVFVGMLVIGVSLAILARVAPQLQIMQFAFPFKIMGGLFLALSTLPFMIPSMNYVFDEMELFMWEILNRG